ncbi:hypothetical protein [Rhizobium leguminosarum]|nr:hypothetical protein [Rhizobium leguminosarum]MBY5797681.1 hypothetical protein [Rhizobium leguminosarum]
MPAPLNRVDTTPELPSTADGVVIGGGIVGVFAFIHCGWRSELGGV